MTLKDKVYYDLLMYTPEQRKQWVDRLKELVEAFAVHQEDFECYGLIFYRTRGGPFVYVTSRSPEEHTATVMCFMNNGIPAGNPAEILPILDKNLGRIR